MKLEMQWHDILWSYLSQALFLECLDFGIIVTIFECHTGHISVQYSPVNVCIALIEGLSCWKSTYCSYYEANVIEKHCVNVFLGSTRQMLRCSEEANVCLRALFMLLYGKTVYLCHNNYIFNKLFCHSVSHLIANVDISQLICYLQWLKHLPRWFSHRSQANDVWKRA